MSVPFLKRASSFLLLLFCVSLFIAPECYPVTNTLTPEFADVQSSKGKCTEPPAVQQPHEATEAYPASPSGSPEGYHYVSDAIGLLQTVATLLGVVITAIGIIFALLGIFGFFELREWKRKRKEFEEQINVAKQRAQEAEEIARKAGIQAEEAKKIAEEVKEMREEAITDAEQIKKIKVEAEKLRNEIPSQPITEVPTEDIKKKLDEFTRRIDFLEKVGVALTPGDYLNKGIYFFYMGNFKEALKAFNTAVELKPDDAVAWTNKGAALEKLSRYEESLTAHEKAIELKPHYDIAWYNKGAALGDLGRYEEALKAFEKAIELNPDDAAAWSNKGVALAKLDRYEEAIKANEKTIELKPDLAGAWFNLACAYALKGDKTNALKHLEKAIELDGKYKEMAKTDKDFKDLWEDEDFKKLVE